MSIKTQLISPVTLGGLLVLQGCVHAAPPTTVNLVTHNEVVINAPPGMVWPHIANIDAWKVGVKLQSISGEPDQVGALFKAVLKDDPRKSVFDVENVEWIKDRRRTIRLDTPDGAFVGFTIWQLTSQNGATLLQYDVYCQGALPADAVTGSPEELAAARKAYHDKAYRRFADELSILKKIVEQSL